jgi:hypothetical protein
MDKSDIFLGSVMITPDLDSPTNGQSCFELQGVASGEIGLQVEYSPFGEVYPNPKASISAGAQLFPLEMARFDGII